MKQPATDVLYECSRLWGLLRQGAQQSATALRHECSRVFTLLRENDIDPFVLVGVILLACLLFGARWARKKRIGTQPESAPTGCVSQQTLLASDGQIAELPEVGGSDDAQLTATRRSRTIPTMLGRVAFKNPHAEGRFGDWLTAQYYTRRRKRPYAKLKSKLPGERGIDGVYRRYQLGRKSTRYTYTYELLIIENKINRGVLSRGQLSVEWVRVQCDKMMKSGDCELLDTASAILHALSQDTAHKAVRLLITHNLVSGTSTRHHVDEFGNKQELQGEWNNGRAVRRSLERKLEKGDVRLADEDA